MVHHEQGRLDLWKRSRHLEIGLAEIHFGPRASTNASSDASNLDCTQGAAKGLLSGLAPKKKKKAKTDTPNDSQT